MYLNLCFDQGSHCLGLQLWPLPCQKLHLCNDPGQHHGQCPWSCHPNHHQSWQFNPKFPGWVEGEGVEESDQGCDEGLWVWDDRRGKARGGYGGWRCLAWEKAQSEERRGKVIEKVWIFSIWRSVPRWGVDQALVTRGLLASNLCPLPSNSTLWDKLAISPLSPSNSSSSLTTSATSLFLPSPSKSTSLSKSSSFLPCYQGDERTCDRSKKELKSCLWWHFHPDQVSLSFIIQEMEEYQMEQNLIDASLILQRVAEMKKKYFQILQKLIQTDLHPHSINKKQL